MHEEEIMNMGKYLAHYGIKGQKHGERRFQNEDGSLTPAGRDRYGVGDPERPSDGMSDQELNDRINRLQKEKQYEDLLRSRALSNASQQQEQQSVKRPEEMTKDEIKQAKLDAELAREKTKAEIAALKNSQTESEYRARMSDLAEREKLYKMSEQEREDKRKKTVDSLQTIGIAIGLVTSAIGIFKAVKDVKGSKRDPIDLDLDRQERRARIGKTQADSYLTRMKAIETQRRFSKR